VSQAPARVFAVAFMRPAG